MLPGAALQAVLLAVLLAGLRGATGRLLSGQPVCRGGTQKPCYEVIYFHDASQRLNFEEARAACRRDGGQLVSIESEDEQRLIEKFIENLLASDGDFWIGLRRREEKQSNGTACQDLYAWIDGSTATFRNWYVDEPSCGSEVCVVMYHQPSAPAGIGGPYMFQWNDDRCTMKNNFICKYSAEKPTAPSTRPGGEGTETAMPILPEDTEKEDATETLKESKEAALKLAYILIPSIPLLLFLVVTTGVCWVWICRRRQVKPSSCKPLCFLNSSRFGLHSKPWQPQENHFYRFERNGDSQTPARRSSAPPGPLLSRGTARTWRFTMSYESRARLI
ncbi:layilin isoform X2 [Mesoplodon densirostris]|uniref:layilin isoform X2 n=1 Tax=Mesoplodon densirostris TaxID=48708 RepID=UPI0028DBD7F4|nr:layilin isoform X2 [Mesoplodon densirostris]